MSYAGLKSMIYAGLKKDDPRVKAATTWIRKNYTLKTNPGLGDMGLYYYYHTVAKALHALGENEKIFVDDKGVKHDWHRVDRGTCRSTERKRLVDEHKPALA